MKNQTSDKLTLAAVWLCELMAGGAAIVLLLRLFQVFPEPLTPLLLPLAPALIGSYFLMFGPYHEFRRIDAQLPEEVRPVVWGKIFLTLHLQCAFFHVVISVLFFILGIPLWIILPVVMEAVLLVLVRPR